MPSSEHVKQLNSRIYEILHIPVANHAMQNDLKLNRYDVADSATPAIEGLEAGLRASQWRIGAVGAIVLIDVARDIKRGIITRPQEEL